MRRPGRALAAAAVAVTVATGAVIALAADGERSRIDPRRQAMAAGVRFLDDYMEPDGRVVRRDQGGDTVSEGQAYAMLVAAAVGDRERFGRAWGWARANLERPDGLMAWRWAGGGVADSEPATDADVDMAHALSIAARRLGVPRYRRAAARIARAVMRRETVRVRGRRFLLAGPWAREGRVVNPSYLSPRAFRDLAGATGDGRWRRISASSLDVLERLTRGGRLPPDWAVVGDHASVRASGPPSGGEPAYGYDAVRVPLRLAQSCRPRARRLGARIWRGLRRRASSTFPPVMSLDGRGRAPGEHASGLVGASAAAHAAGRRSDALELLDRAARLDREQPSYYGGAMVALGRLVLSTELLDPCP